MFPDSSIAHDFKCASTKMGYLITHAVAPHFEDLLVKDIKASNSAFTLHYDETTTSQIKKQLDIIVQYWSSENKRIVVHYLGSLFFGHATAEVVSDKLLEFISTKGLPLCRLLSVSSDGPNVNKAIETRLNKALVDANLPLLVDIGTCTLHMVYNAFGKGIQSFGHDAQDFTVKLFCWFKHSAARREDFKVHQLEEELNDVFLLRHVPSRWLTLQPAVIRILEQWPAIVSYFQQLPKDDKLVGKKQQLQSCATVT